VGARPPHGQMTTTLPPAAHAGAAGALITIEVNSAVNAG
jgi:hypothetical protein